MKLKQTEQDIQKTIIEFLKWKHLFYWRNNTGAFIDNQKHLYRFGSTGSPDIFVVIKGQIFGIEVKSATGKQSPNQKEWEESFTKAGGIYLLIRSLKELEQTEIFG